MVIDSWVAPLQDKLWEEMEGKERQGKQAQQAAKKNKKVKKKTEK